MPGDFEQRITRLEDQMQAVTGKTNTQQTSLDSLITQADQHDDFTTNFAIPGTAGVVLTSATITVPNGFTRAQVIAHGTVCAFNSTAGNDLILILIGINGGYSSGMFGQQTPTGLVGTAHNHQVRLLTGLTAGATFTTTIKVNANGGNPWAASASATARLSTFVTFLR